MSVDSILNETTFPYESCRWYYRPPLYRVIHTLGQSDKVSPDQILDIWTIILEPEQVFKAFRTLSNVNDKYLDNFEMMRRSDLGKLIYEWAMFESLIPIRPVRSAVEIMRLILMHCMELERFKAPATYSSNQILCYPDPRCGDSNQYEISILLDAFKYRVNLGRELQHVPKIEILGKVRKYVSELSEQHFSCHSQSFDRVLPVPQCILNIGDIYVAGFEYSGLHCPFCAQHYQSLWDSAQSSGRSGWPLPSQLRFLEIDIDSWFAFSRVFLVGI